MLVSALAAVPVSQVSVGENHVAAVSRHGDVYAWGGGQERPQRMSFGGGGAIAGVACGWRFTLAVAADGVLYSWGHNGKYGVLGLGAKRGAVVDAPTAVPGLPPVAFAKAGSLCAGAVTASGQLWMWGCGLSGALGQGDRKTHATPQPVGGALTGRTVTAFSVTVGQIAEPSGRPGEEGPHAMCVAEGVCFTWGTCHKGLLGNMNRKVLAPPDGDELLPYAVGSPCRDGDGKPSGYLDGEEAVDVRASAIHSAVLCKSGTLYTFGCGSNGRMGVQQYMTGLAGKRSRMKCYVSRPTPVETTRQIVGIDTARRHMIAVAADGSRASAPATDAGKDVGAGAGAGAGAGSDSAPP